MWDMAFGRPPESQLMRASRQSGIAVAAFIRPKSNFLDHYAISLDLDDLDPRAGLHIAPFGDDIDIVFAKAYLAGRAQGGGRLSNSAQEVSKPGRGRLLVFE